MASRVGVVESVVAVESVRQETERGDAPALLDCRVGAASGLCLLLASRRALSRDLSFGWVDMVIMFRLIFWGLFAGMFTLTVTYIVVMHLQCLVGKFHEIHECIGSQICKIVRDSL
jgi:hypothetical protein